MKVLKQLMAGLLVTLAASTMMVACGGDDDPCTIDSDCTADQVCEADVCVDTCTGDADCAAGETCEARTSGVELVCKAGGGTNNVNNTNNINNTNNTNNAGTTYGFFMVTDTTVDGCAVSDPGSDLQYIAITDSGGATLGHALLRDQVFGPETNDFIDTAILDGNPPDFAGQCADDFNDTTVVSMGCGGTFLFQALDGTGTPFAIEAGVHQLEIGEYGSTCQGSADDAYEVFGCTAGDGALASSTCDVSFGTGEGITIVDVAE